MKGRSPSLRGLFPTVTKLPSILSTSLLLCQSFPQGEEGVYRGEQTDHGRAASGHVLGARGTKSLDSLQAPQAPGWFPSILSTSLLLCQSFPQGEEGVYRGEQTDHGRAASGHVLGARGTKSLDSLQAPQAPGGFRGAYPRAGRLFYPKSTEGMTMRQRNGR